MPDVGVLELKIRDNAETAAGGLDQLSGALNKVRQACAGALGLDNVASEVVKLAQTVQNAKGTSTIVRNLGTMFNAISKFSNIKKFSINSDEIRKAAQSMLLWADARDKFNEVAQSGAGVTDWRMGMGEIVDSTKKTVDEVKSETTELTKELTHFQQIIGKTKSIQIFGKKKQVPGQIAMDLDGTAQKIQEVVSKISVTDAAATSIADKIEDTGKKFASAISAETITTPLEKISDTFRNMTTNIRYYGSALDTVIPKVQALSSAEMIEAGNARYAAMSEREQMLVMAEATGKIKSIKEMNTNDVFVGMEQTTEKVDQMNISLRETGDIVESVVIPRFQEMYAIWSQWAYEFNAFQMAGSRLMSGNSPMLLGDGRTVGQLLLGDGSEPQTFLSTWVDTGEQFRTNWVMFTSDVAEQWRAQWSPDWILGGWNVPQSMSTFHLGAGANQLLLGDGGVSPENTLSTMVDYSEQWEQNWIYGEGTVTETVEETERVAAATRDATDEAERYAEQFEHILKEQEEAAALAASIREQQEAAFNGTNNGSAAGQNTTTVAVSQAALDAQWLDNLVENASQIDLLNMRIESMTDRLYEGATSGRMTGEQIADLVARIQNARQQLDELNDAMHRHIDIAGGVAGAYNFLKTGIEKMFPTITGLIKQFARMAKMRAIRYIIRQIAAGFKEGIQNVYEYSKAVGNSFAPSMDSAASSLATMKNALGAAAAPLLQSLIPVLQSVVNWFINLTNYANQFFALLNGQSSWLRATPQTTTAFNKQEKAAKSAGAAIKDLLADWDELNIIQSNTSGGGGGASNTAAEDYLSMFEEVGEFNNKVEAIVKFIKDNMDDVLGLVKDIGAAILLWRFSDAFLGNLGALSSIIKIGVLVMLSYSVTNLLDEAYIQSEANSSGLLIANAVINGLFAAMAFSFGEKVSKGVGSIAASIVLAVSAGVDFANAQSVTDTKNEAKANALLLLGGIKAGIAFALASIGFMKMTGGNIPLSFVAGAATVAIVTTISYSTKFAAEKEEEAEAFAKRVFSDVGEGGTIDPQSYVTALENEFKLQTSGAQLVIDAYVNVPDLRGKLTTAMIQIAGFNSIILKGNGKLTASDAQSFKENWGIVLETLNQMNTANYDTILAGLTTALASKNEELRELARETRNIFLEMEQNVAEEDKELFERMQYVKDNLVGEDGQVNTDLLDEYTRLYSYFAASTRSGFDEVSSAIKAGENLNFGDASVAFDNAKSFINDVKSSAQEAINAENNAFDDIKNSIETKMAQNEKKYKELHIIDEAEYLARKTEYENILAVAEAYRTEQVGKIEDLTGQAYTAVLQNALSSEGAADPDYWRKVIVPLVQEMQGLGLDIPQVLLDAMKEQLTSGLYNSENQIIFDKEMQEFFNSLKIKNSTAQEVVDGFKEQLDDAFASAKSRNMVPDYYESILTMYNVDSFDKLTDTMKEQILANAKLFWNDPSFIQELATAIGYTGNPIDIPVAYKFIADPEPVNEIPKVKDVKEVQKELDSGFNLFYTPPEDVTKGQYNNVFEDAWNSISQWWNRLPFSYKPPEELAGEIEEVKSDWQKFLEEENDIYEDTELPSDNISLYSNVFDELTAKAEDANEAIKETLDTAEELRKLIFDHDNGIGSMDRIMYWNTVLDLKNRGEYDALDALRQYIEQYGVEGGFKTYDEFGAGVGKIRSGQYIANAGSVSDVGWTPRNIGSVFASQAESDADMQNNISSGTQKGTQDMLSVLNNLLTVAQAINRKDFTVVIKPTATMGDMMARSADLFGMVTGE